MTDSWTLIHAERRALVDDLSSLTPDQWAQPSLCAGWSVRDVLAHMTATAKMTPGKFFRALIGSGFKFNAMGAKVLAKELGSSGADTLGNFRAVVDATTHPPGPTLAMLGEVVVHSGDIRRPLGIAHAYSPEALTGSADFYKSSNLLIGAKNRLAGLTLRATDIDWSNGSGPEVTGPMISLVLAMCGRASALDDLSGEGVGTMRGRI
jgi:uncharacterized protein (TIGR03083 family)